MNKLYLLDSRKRTPFFEETSSKLGIPAPLVEKDYWVVWILERLFGLPELKNHLTFKGGTSLSKVYQIIKRFSEDIDLSIEKAFFGFPSEELESPETSRKQKNISLQHLSHQCSQYIEKTLQEILTKEIGKALNPSDTWNLSMDESDPSKQTLLFEYPTLETKQYGYIRPSIKIELGARAEHWPVSERPIRSYAKEILQDKLDEPAVTVRVLNVERTFWEKATILHQYAHLPESKTLPPRISRHYYDFYHLLKSIKDLALENQHLLEKVAHHKNLYFPSAWAQYSQAKKGTLKLIPSDDVSRSLQKDYLLMKEMLFEEPVDWSEILELIRKFELEFNA